MFVSAARMIKFIGMHVPHLTIRVLDRDRKKVRWTTDMKEELGCAELEPEFC